MTHPYKKQPEKAFWSSTVDFSKPGKYLADIYTKKFDISGRRIASAGSCFAQHIGRHLKKGGLDFLDMEPKPSYISDAMAAEYNFGLYSARYGNVYTPRQLLQLFDRAFGLFVPVEKCWKRGNGAVDPFRPNIEPKAFIDENEMRRCQEFHLRKVKELFEKTEVFIFTLGLTETWLDLRDGAVFPVVPGTALGGDFEAGKYVFHNFDYTETVADLELFLGKLRELNSEAKMLLTVSPVPLTATATGQNVLCATVYSKSVLRAAAGYLASKYETVDYFPAYEIIASHPSHGVFYKSDGRGVSKSGVEKVMNCFFTGHGLAVPDSELLPLSLKGHARGPQAPDDADLYEVCEEAMLEAERLRRGA